MRRARLLRSGLPAQGGARGLRALRRAARGAGQSVARRRAEADRLPGPLRARPDRGRRPRRHLLPGRHARKTSPRSGRRRCSAAASVERLLVPATKTTGQSRTTAEEIPFYQGQHRIVLALCGVIDARRSTTTSPPADTRRWPRRFASMTPGGGHRRGQPLRPARPRRRRLSHRPEVASPPRDAHGEPEVRDRQRRRGRPRGVHGPGADGRRAARGDRRDDHRRLRHRLARRATSTSATSIPWPSST